MPQTVTLAVEIKPATTHAHTGRTGGLHHALQAYEITQRLGVQPSRGSADDKVDYEWDFTVGGQRCSIWDYKGTRWSTCGPRAVFEALFPSLVIE